MTQIGFMIKEADQPNVEKILDFAKDNLDNEQLLAKMAANPEIKAAAEQMKKLLQTAGQGVESDEEMPKDLGLDEGALGDAWLKLSVAVGNGTEALGSALQTAWGLNPKMAALGAGLLAMTVASSDPQQAQAIMKLAMAASSGDGSTFLEQASDIAVDMTAESKQPLEDTIMEAVMELMDEDLEDRHIDKSNNEEIPLSFDTRVNSSDTSNDEEESPEETKSGSESDPADPENENAKTIEYLLDQINDEASAKEIVKNLKTIKKEEGKVIYQAIDELGGVEAILETLKDDNKQKFQWFVAALQPEKSPNKEVDEMKVSMEKYNKFIEDRKDIFFAVEGSFAQVRKMAFVPKPVEGQEPVAFLSGEESVKLPELGVDPKNLKGDLGSVIVVRSKDLYNIRKIQKEAPEGNVVDIVPIDRQKQLDGMISGTKLNDQGGPLEGSGLFFVKNDSEEMAPVGAAQDQTSELDISKAQEKYGKTLEGVFDGEELTLIIKFLALLMKDDLLNENLRDVLKGIGLGGGKIATAIKAGQESGVFTQDEIKKVSAIFKDNPEKTKKFIAAITQTSKPQEKEKTEPETGASKKEDAVKVDGLVDALDEFMGTPAGNKPNFYYPRTNLLKEQGEMLLKLYSKIRVLLDLPTIEFHRALLAYNDLNTGPEQAKKEPAPTPEPSAEPAQADAPAPAKRDDLYEAKDISAKEVQPKNLVILRDYILEALTTVQIYMKVAEEGQRGSKELYSKYGSVLGTAAYEPKKVLYQINLKNIVNLCNSFLTRLDAEMKASPGDSETEINEAKTTPFAEIVQQVKGVFNFVVTEGTQLKKMIIDHADKAEPEQQNEQDDPAQAAREANPESDGKDITRVKPSVDAIRKSGQEIHDQLKSIQEHFPLVNPFDSEEYGTQGFENAIAALKNAMSEVVNISGQVSKAPTFGEVSGAAKKALYDVLERTVKTIKDTFAGQYSERPAANEKASEDDFSQDGPSVSTEPTDIDVGSEPSVNDPEVDKYLKQNNDFYNKTKTKLDRIESGNYGDLKLQEADGQESPSSENPIKTLKSLKDSIEEKEKTLTSDKSIRKNSSKLAQALRSYKGLLKRYVSTYDAFKMGDYQVSSDAEEGEDKAIATLQETLERHKGLYDACLGLNNLILNEGDISKNNASIAAIFQVLDQAKAGITKSNAVAVNKKVQKETSSEIKQQDKREDKLVPANTAGNIKTDTASAGEKRAQKILALGLATIGAGTIAGWAIAEWLLASGMSESEEDSGSAKDTEAATQILEGFFETVRGFILEYKTLDVINDNVEKYIESITNSPSIVNASSKKLLASAKAVTEYVAANGTKLKEYLQIEESPEDDEEEIQGEEPTAADLASAGPNKPVRVASPRRNVAAEALINKLKPIIREMMRGQNG